MDIIRTQNVGFLSAKAYSRDVIVEIIKQSKVIPFDLKAKIINRISEIIGNQEIEWLRHNTDDLDAYILHRYKFKIYPQEKILEDFPLHLLIEPTSVCNLRCKMCFQTDESFTVKSYMGMMDLDLFKSLVDQAVENQCRALTLASRGEPTLHPKFKEMLEYCKGKFFELKINTNATKLTEELSRIILDCGVDIVVFSVDSYRKEEYEKIRKGANFEDVLQNIKRFSNIKNSHPKYAKTTTRISGVLLPDGEIKQDKDLFLSFWGKIVDDVCYREAITRWYSYGREHLNYDVCCNLLWERLYVWYDGICNPCDFDYKSYLKTGSAKTQSLKEIWTGPALNRMRQLHLSGGRKSLVPCDRCNLV